MIWAYIQMFTVKSNGFIKSGDKIIIIVFISNPKIHFWILILCTLKIHKLQENIVFNIIVDFYTRTSLGFNSCKGNPAKAKLLSPAAEDAAAGAAGAAVLVCDSRALKADMCVLLEESSAAAGDDGAEAGDVKPEMKTLLIFLNTNFLQKNNHCNFSSLTHTFLRALCSKRLVLNTDF